MPLPAHALAVLRSHLVHHGPCQRHGDLQGSPHFIPETAAVHLITVPCSLVVYLLLAHLAVILDDTTAES